MSDVSGGEDIGTRRKRLLMRSMRRGIKEMDLILSAFAAARLPDMGADELDAYDRLLSENDHDLYAWVSAQAEPPEYWAGLIGEIRAEIANN